MQVNVPVEAALQPAGDYRRPVDLSAKALELELPVKAEKRREMFFFFKSKIGRKMNILAREVCRWGWWNQICRFSKIAGGNAALKYKDEGSSFLQVLYCAKKNDGLSHQKFNTRQSLIHWQQVEVSNHVRKTVTARYRHNLPSHGACDITKM